jgi:caa(3)-type oxidase subunit IV
MTTTTSKRKQYMMVFFALIILTVLELTVVYLGISRALLISALIGLAIAKAAAVALYFMHLREETSQLRWIVGGTLLSFPPLYAFVLIAEAIYRHGILGH